MARFHFLWFSFSFFLLCASFGGKTNAAQEERKIYIGYMGAIPDTEYSLSARHASIIQEVVGGSSPEQYLVRSYTKSFNGFAVNLTEQEYKKLAAQKAVLSIFPSTTLQLHTTESWDFSGVPLNVNRNLTMESDVIIGVFDTGIWPESKSFSEHGLGPVPKKWKGTCEGGQNFTCNRKIIGARNYNQNEISSRDYIGHGSHTASTAAGNIVANTSFYGIAKGTARGGVPSARIAVYKVCSSGGCTAHDVMSAFDDAIADGVDILSLSLGGREPVPWQNDVIAIGSFHATLNGILTVNSAGNNGFEPGTTTSVVPWLFTVAASSTKRQIVSKVSLGNGKKMIGRGINSFNLKGKDFPLVYGADATESCNATDAKLCFVRCLEKQKVKGKIVICNDEMGVSRANIAGALGAIAKIDTVSDVSFIVPLPASVLSNELFEKLESYYNSTKNPRGNVLYSESIENKTAPVVASFSSRGPNQIIGDILKPDITAPGVDILAAYSPAASPSNSITDERSVSYSFLSGTSMACPHVAGAAGYVKSWHPDWSPSAIKSALMTTAWRMNASDSVYGDAEFSYGAGHFDPVKALNPGLVYETRKEDYVNMICNMDFDDGTWKKIFGDNTTCPHKYEESWPKDLNYPSMTSITGMPATFSVTFPRMVTNVGIANSTYKVITHCGHPKCNITVNPSVLSFKALKERKSFNVTVSSRNGFDYMLSASIEWSDGVHSVRSPIVLYRLHDYRKSLSAESSRSTQKLVAGMVNHF